ncbi:MAG: Gfo/Idh/MocA family oxidoreductase [Planctomycetes bacterium]|nr:Gfo/Idh/MocA family oxidoreductase [Planctomycetota bacterium]
MNENKLKTAVIGLGEKGQMLLEAAAGGCFGIIAVADKDLKLAESTAAKFGCVGFDDYRQLIIQNQLDCLLVADGLHNCAEQIKTAIKKQVNIFKLAPLGRDFDQASEFAGLAEMENVKFAVGITNRFSQSYSHLRQFLEQGKAGRIFSLSAVCNVNSKTVPGWQSDLKLAGGGVLLQNCYGLIDTIVSNFKIPQQIYALITSKAGDKKQRMYLTEDTAVITMKFSDTLFGNLVANRTFGDSSEWLKIFGENKILTVKQNRFTVTDSAGQIEEDLVCTDNLVGRLSAQLENFALSISRPSENKLISSAAENLNTMRVLQAAYLSARTGFCEEPGKTEPELRI